MKKGLFVLVVALLLNLAIVASAQGPGTWIEHPGNPIFGQGVGDPKAYYPSVLYDADSFSGHGASAKYKMWYGSSGGTGYATSDDGLIWSDYGLVSGLAANANHATIEYYSEGFSGANAGNITMYYRIWYWQALTYSINDVRYAESPDGEEWLNDQPLQNGAVPIVSGGDPWWNRGSYGPADILYFPGSSNTGTDWTFRMYYDGTDGGDESIGLGFSADGITWTGYDADGDGGADPVLVGGSYSDWDGGTRGYVSRCTVLYAGGEYEMWYSGGLTRMHDGIGYATSPDGITWTKDSANPIFLKTDGVVWRNDRTYCPAVLKDGSTYKMWFSGKGSGYSIGYATVLGEVWVDDDYCNVCANDGHIWGYDAFDNVQDGIDAVAGSTVNVAAGTYNENVTVDKRLSLLGAGSGNNPAVDTIVQATQANKAVIQITGSGASATDRLIVKSFRLTGATGGGNVGSGVEIEGSGSTNYVTLDDLTTIGNGGHGIAIDHTGTMADLVVNNCRALNNGGMGLSTPHSLGSLNGLTVTDCHFEGNTSIGLWVETANSTNVTISGTTFKNNAPGIDTCGDLILSPFNGDATITNVQVTSNNADSGIRISGASTGSSPSKTAAGPSGTVALSNITIGGHQAMAALAISRYNDASGISLSNVQLNSTAPAALHIGTMSGSMAIGNTTFSGTFAQGDILLGTHRNSSNYVKATVSVDATSVTFSGAADNFAIEDRVYHALDDADLGTVTWVAGSVFVTPSSGSIQRGIDAVSGSTVNVAAGTYSERLTINKSLSLRGAQYGADPTQTGARTNPADESTITEAGLSTPNPDVLIEIPSGISNVTVDGFTLNGDQTNTTADTSVLRIWGDDITISNNIIDGMYAVLYKGGNTLTVGQNRVTANKIGVTVQPNPATDVAISDNVFSLGSDPVGDESAMYMTSCSNCSVTGNTATGFVNGKGVGGSNLTNIDVSGNTFTGNKDAVSFWGSTTFVAISDNDLSNSSRYGISIKGQDITITGNEIANNGDTGINIDRHVIDTERVTISNNDISGNTNYGVKVNTALVTEIIDAENNWWGSVDGAEDTDSGTNEVTLANCGSYTVAQMLNVVAEISGSLGNKVSDNVDYCPWLISSWPYVGFAQFTIDHAKIDFKKRPDDDKVRVQGSLELDRENGDGVCVTDDVTVTVGTLSETITMMEKGKKGDNWEYKRPKDGAGDIKHMTIDWKNGRFDIRMDEADLAGVTNPVFISVQIGDDVGSESITMREKKHHWDYKAPKGPKAVEIEPLAIADELKVVAYPNPIRDVNTATFQVMGALAAEVEEIRVQIYDLSGHLVWEDAAFGGELDWHTDSLSGDYLANGIYLYIVQVRIGGSWISQNIGKIAVLR